MKETKGKKFTKKRKASKSGKQDKKRKGPDTAEKLKKRLRDTTHEYKLRICNSVREAAEKRLIPELKLVPLNICKDRYPLVDGTLTIQCTKFNPRISDESIVTCTEIVSRWVHKNEDIFPFGYKERMETNIVADEIRFTVYYCLGEDNDRRKFNVKRMLAFQRILEGDRKAMKRKEEIYLEMRKLYLKELIECNKPHGSFRESVDFELDKLATEWNDLQVDNFAEW